MKKKFLILLFTYFLCGCLYSNGSGGGNSPGSFVTSLSALTQVTFYASYSDMQTGFPALALDAGNGTATYTTETAVSTCTLPQELLDQLNTFWSAAQICVTSPLTVPNECPYLEPQAGAWSVLTGTIAAQDYSFLLLPTDEDEWGSPCTPFYYFCDPDDQDLWAYLGNAIVAAIPTMTCQ